MLLEVNIKKKLRNFTLQADFKLENEVLGLMGISGSGKSMLLKCLAGIESPDEGYIILDGVTLFDSDKNINVAVQKRCIGYLFQNYALFPNMSVAENILCGLRAKNCTKRECNEKLEQLVSLFRLNGMENAFPRQLSGGQKQRVALARLLGAEPEIILLDEPFSALDAGLKEELQAELKILLKNYGKAAVLVSHDKQEVYRLSGRQFYIKDGIVAERKISDNV